MALQIQAQTPPPPTNTISYATTTPTFGAGHDYIQMLGETVDPGSGQLSVRIKIPTPPGRGLNFPFGLNYDSAGAIQLTQADPPTLNLVVGEVDMYPQSWSGMSTGDISSGGWSDSLPQISLQKTSYTDPNLGVNCHYTANLAFTDETGDRHWLGFVVTDGSDPSGSAGQYCIPTSGTSSMTTPDRKYQATVGPGTVVVASQDGTVYTFPYSPLADGGCATEFPPCSGTFSSPPYSIEDRNGNLETFSLVGTHIEDTLGRTLLSYSVTPPSTSTYYVSGTPSPYVATWSYTQISGASYPYTLVSSNGGQCAMDAGRVYPYSSSQTVTAVGALELPDGTAYQFTYDPVYGLLNKITYPNGAYTSYTWSIPGLNDDAFYTWVSTSVLQGTGIVNSTVSSCYFQYGRPQVSSRIVSYDGVHPALEQDFTYATTFSATSGNIASPGWSQKIATVVTHDLLRGTSYTTQYTYVPGGNIPGTPFIPGWNMIGGQQTANMSDWPAVEQSVQYFDTSGNTLQTVNKTWLDLAHLQTQQTVLGATQSGAPTTETDYTYTPAGMLQEKDIYDYGVGAKGALLQKTVSSFPAALGNGGITPLYPYGPTLNAFPSSVIVSNGSGTLAETDYLYDQGGISPASAVQHDNTNYGAGSTAPRANATTVTKKCLQAQGCTNAVTTYVYDQAGQLASMTDPCGNGICSDMTGSAHTTYYSYADAFVPGAVLPSGATDAYVTSITQPAVSAGSFTTTFQYGYSDGKLRSVKDANQHTTQFCYYIGGCNGFEPDPWMRLTQVSYPDGGKATASYVDTGSNPSTTISKIINGAATEVNTTIFDAMGRAIQTQLNSDPDGADFVDTTYDGESRIWTVSNPHRSAPAIPDGTTTLVYDALGRKKVQTNPDTTSESWLYSGNSTTLTNEVSNSWTNLSDALGRLTQVTEPGGLNTLYSYDALGNLLSVNQRGNGSTDTPRAARSFNYDSLSQLLCASNPENSFGTCSSTATGSYVNGTTGYAYDANGNVSYRTAPQPNAPTGSAQAVTTNYFYDNLNRLLSKSYTNAPSGSFTSCYAYDIAGNGKGRLAAEWTQFGSCPSPPSVPTSSYMTERVISGYDTMGRVTIELQCTPGTSGSCANSNTNTYQLAYSYDLAGNLVTYGTGVNAGLGVNPFTLTNTFDGANRLSTLTSSWLDNHHPAALFTADPNAGYTPAGATQNMLLGDYMSVTKTYDSRLRITGETATYP
jgi:YD repeat-containing protein